MLARDARGRMQRPTAEADNSPEPEAPDEADVGRDVGCGFLPAGPADIEGVREGLIPSIVATQRQSPKDRPWGKRYKVRNRRGVAY